MSDDDVATFLSSLADPPSGVVQYNHDNNRYEPVDIARMCAMVENASAPIDGFAAFVKFYANFTAQSCISSNYKKYIADMQASSAGRSWYWQTCTEYGYYQTGEHKAQPFPAAISLPFFLKGCTDIFGVDVRPNIDFTNAYYGGRNFRGTNVFFPKGSVDPWTALGTDETRQLDLVLAMTIQGTAHCADL